MIKSNLVLAMEAIFSQIDTITDSKGIRVFRTRGIWNDQVKRLLEAKNYERFPPSVYLEMKMLNPTNLGQKENAFDIEFRFHIVMMELNANNTSMDNNINIFTFRDLVNAAMVAFMPPQCGPLNYIGENPSYNHTNLYEYILRYHSHYIDTSAVNQFSVTGSNVAGITGSIGFTYSLSESYQNYTNYIN